MKRLWHNTKFRENLAGYLFILPNLSGYVLFILLPILFSLYLVFNDWEYLKGFSGIHWIGLDNFKALGDDPKFLKALKNNILFTVVSVPASLIFGLLLAVILNKYVFFKNMLRTFIFLPYVSSLVAVSVVWSIMYNARTGPINQFLHAIGISHPPGWLSSPQSALYAIIIMSVWVTIGYAMVIYLAGIQGIPKDLYEASDIDGATKLRQFFQITVPMLTPTTFLVIVTLMIWSFQVFGPVAVMTQGGPIDSTMVLSYHIYKLAFSFYRMGYAATVSWVLFALIFIVTLIQWQFQKRWQQYF
ncbi:sugar ABC transporter permease [Paenibacillus psychroresistens]|uniref:Sugar ABC transporter permease n=1 Tax=Paenibacillus psychroresistens TaxID=1778678 RepID=A0A6B8RI84_9BACL|nr:sugar ABC transporter permease [Paenibacillus psychroresistens]QGQ95597.1 sugar ABC transporter permease [Paenibacillus psychroresistens]